MKPFNIVDLPFNKLIGLQSVASGSNLMVALPDATEYRNHLGTVHASALLAVAEAGSGEFLLRGVGHLEGVVPVVRKLEAKFRKPASGSVVSRCDLDSATLSDWIVELESRGRISAVIPIDVIDSTGEVVLSAVVEWFVTRRGQLPIAQADGATGVFA